MKKYYATFILPSNLSFGFVIQEMNREPYCIEDIESMMKMIEGDDKSKKPIILNWKELKQEGGEKLE